MKHLKTYEGLFDFLRLKSKKIQPKVGDYVILKDDSSLKKEFWYNFYGKIIDIGTFIYKEKNELYLIEFLNEMSKEDQDRSRINFLNSIQSIESSGYSNKNSVFFSSGGRKSQYTPLPLNQTPRIATKKCMWFIKNNIKFFNTKDEWQIEVDKIELEKEAKKYNI